MLSEDEFFRAQDLDFLALLRSLPLAELMRLEQHEENQLTWRQAAISRAIWKALLR